MFCCLWHLCGLFHISQSSMTFPSWKSWNTFLLILLSSTPKDQMCVCERERERLWNMALILYSNPRNTFKKENLHSEGKYFYSHYSHEGSLMSSCSIKYERESFAYDTSNALREREKHIKSPTLSHTSHHLQIFCKHFCCLTLVFWKCKIWRGLREDIEGKEWANCNMILREKKTNSKYLALKIMN